MAKLFTDWLVAQVDRAGGTRPANADQVRSLPAPRPGEGTSYEFDGNRIELLAAGPLDGKVDVTVDGKAPRDLDGCWQTSRVSRLPTITDWPAIKRVTVDPATHEAERWTITVTNLDDKQEKFDFTLSSSRGALGSGKGDQSFTSSDGRVTIEPGDWNLAYARIAGGKGVEDGTSFTFDRHFVCNDQSPVALPNGAVEQRHVIATGLSNGHHVVKLSAAPDAPAISEARAYRPPWK
jgi:hypothetical protein